MPYQITDYSRKRAKELGVEIKPAQNKSKKIDVYKNGTKITSIGATGYMDYPTYIKNRGRVFADKRRDLYLQRHARDSGVAGYYARELLW